MKCEIKAIANQKGGAGKTTTAYNMGYALAKMGKKVLLVDNDPQANLTRCFGFTDPTDIPFTLHDAFSLLILDEDLPAKETYIYSNGGLDIIPSNLDLTATEINLRSEVGADSTLSLLLEPLRAHYDYILIDTTPYLGLLTVNALAACDSVIIPVNPQLWSATGLTDLVDTIAKIRKRINTRITIDGILFTLCQPRTRLHRNVLEIIDEAFGKCLTVYKTAIPYTVCVGESNFYSRSVIDYNPNHPVSTAYMEFAKEVMDNHGWGEASSAV